MELHGSFVDVGLKGGVVIGKRWEFVSQGVPPSGCIAMNRQDFLAAV
jgi:hypothetical protein